MKKLFPFFACVVFIACNSNEKKAEAPKNTDLIQENLKGKVKHFEESSFTIDSTGMSKVDATMNASDLDEKGYQVAFVVKDNNGKIKEEQTLTHYDGGQIKEVKSKNGEGKQNWRWEISIDSSGKYKDGKLHDSSDKITSYYRDLSENEFGEITAGTEYKTDNTKKSAFTNSYDNNGHFTGSTGQDSAGKETFRSTFKLNDKGDVIEETRISTSNNSTKTEHFTYKYDSYDEKGNWTQRTQYNDKGKPIAVVKRTYTYYKD